MGGLFSKKQQPAPPSRVSPLYQHQPRPTQTLTRESSSTPLYSSHFCQPAYQPRPAPPRPTQPRPSLPQNAVSRLPLMPVIYDDCNASEWDLNPLPHGESFRLVNISVYDEDFIMVKEAFYEGARGKNFNIINIERVENPFLLGFYLLKKEEMINCYGDVEEEVHFHGTKTCNVRQICENNFNWRLHGNGTGNRFGKGVSFSPISYYASHYSDKNTTNKVMFYVRVLVSNSVVGNQNMILPPKLCPSSNSRYDTAEKEDGHVVVKFSDNEFYPEFIIHYKTPAALNQPKHRSHAKKCQPQQPSYTYNFDD